MKYDWEGRIDETIMDDIEALLPEGTHLIGVAVDNAETCEGALILRPSMPTAGLLMTDLFQDILGDAQGYYNTAIEVTFQDDLPATVH